MNLTEYDALSFDCYGTLIDWEAGIANVLIPWANRQGLELSPDQLLENYATHEARILSQNPTILYPNATAEAFAAVGATLEREVTAIDRVTMSESVPNWPVFEDTARALRQLARHYKLIILSNIDNASFRKANKKLGVEFHEILTAENIGSYKPAAANFSALFDAIEKDGIPRERLLHVAQSLFHDHVPAKQMGLASIWIDRRHDRPGWGATPPPAAEAEPARRYESMQEFANACTHAFRESE